VSVITRAYGGFDDFSRFWAAKNKVKQSQFSGLWPEIRSTKLETRIKRHLTESNLKKQSQFVEGANWR